MGFTFSGLPVPSRHRERAKELYAAMRNGRLKSFETWGKALQPAEPCLGTGVMVTLLKPEVPTASGFSVLIFPNCSIITG